MQISEPTKPALDLSAQTFRRGAAVLVALGFSGLCAPVMAQSQVVTGYGAGQLSPLSASSRQLTADVGLTGLADWVSLRQALARLQAPIIVQIDSLSNSGAVLTFGWNGDRAQLDQALERVGYRIAAVNRQTGRVVLQSIRQRQ